jgi:large conductance mechanosensitive channel
MGMVSEFKEFIAKGNVLDLAVGVVIGAAFGKVVSTLVDGIIMPIVGMLTGGVSVSDWKYVIAPAVTDAAGKVITPGSAIAYGMFIQAIVDFLIVAFVIFMVIKAYNRMRKPDQAAPAVPPEDVLLLREIRDSLRGPRSL